MEIKRPLMILGALFSATAFNAHASLTSYTANGVDFVRMQGGGFDVSFTKDGNLFKTLYSSNANLISQIAAVIPTYSDPAYGLQTIDTADFNTSNGQMSWWGAKAFINYLNNINYGGSHQWSLPGVTDIGGDSCNFAYSGTDCGYNVDTSTDALAQMYYGELNKKALYNTSGAIQNGYGIFGNNGAQVAGGAVGPFTNAQSSTYWSGTEYFAPIPSGAWNFNTNYGYQEGNGKYRQFYAWAVSPGQVAAVPVPGAVWLFGTALVGWLGLKRRGHAG